MEHILYINSSERNSGSSEDFQIDADPALFNIPPKYVKATRVCIPYTWYNVNSNNNKFFLLEDGQPNIQIVITPGNYTFSGFATVVQTAMNAATLAGALYSVTPDSINTKYTITSTMNFRLDFNSPDSMYSILGFPNNYVSSTVLSITSLNVVNLSPYSEILVCSNIVDGIDNGYQILSSTAASSKILLVVPITTSFGSNINYTPSTDNPKFIVSQSKLGQKNTTPIEMEFYILFSNGDSIDLNGSNWSMDLVLSNL
jgi:hypothetical protein